MESGVTSCLTWHVSYRLVLSRKKKETELTHLRLITWHDSLIRTPFDLYLMIVTAFVMVNWYSFIETTSSKLILLPFWKGAYSKRSRPRWLSCMRVWLETRRSRVQPPPAGLGGNWMRRPTGDQEVAGSTPAEVGNILSWRLIMKYILRSFSPFRWFKKGSCQFLAKECAQYWLTA